MSFAGNIVSSKIKIFFSTKIWLSENVSLSNYLLSWRIESLVLDPRVNYKDAPGILLWIRNVVVQHHALICE